MLISNNLQFIQRLSPTNCQDPQSSSQPFIDIGQGECSNDTCLQ
jgi:hypothetical protein